MRKGRKINKKEAGIGLFKKNWSSFIASLFRLFTKAWRSSCATAAAKSMQTKSISTTTWRRSTTRVSLSTVLTAATNTRRRETCWIIWKKFTSRKWWQKWTDERVALFPFCVVVVVPHFRKHFQEEVQRILFSKKTDSIFKTERSFNFWKQTSKKFVNSVFSNALNVFSVYFAFFWNVLNKDKNYYSL